MPTDRPLDMFAELIVYVSLPHKHLDRIDITQYGSCVILVVLKQPPWSIRGLVPPQATPSHHRFTPSCRTRIKDPVVHAEHLNEMIALSSGE